MRVELKFVHDSSLQPYHLGTVRYLGNEQSPDKLLKSLWLKWEEAKEFDTPNSEFVNWLVENKPEQFESAEDNEVVIVNI